MKKIEELLLGIKITKPDVQQRLSMAVCMLMELIDEHDGYGLNTIVQTATHRYELTMKREDI